VDGVVGHGQKQVVNAFLATQKTGRQIFKTGNSSAKPQDFTLNSPMDATSLS
jgi:hypothetical protein